MLVGNLSMRVPMASFMLRLILSSMMLLVRRLKTLKRELSISAPSTSKLAAPLSRFLLTASLAPTM